ncbi:hypothetical protein BVC80_1787g98 [Macleaya cordata]|uniref:Protein PAIR1 n=1 Tax=Macleaya cordata TaxID=56857 RepID=A0A200QUA2_MACCD|nr:hypothetical protein BVC80_1787g98 [Macleaya cordata]
MKLKINKACDLNSISVLPPHSRRPNAISSGTDSSVFGKSQASQIRSQQSQQSFSQGLSSQLSQNSLDEIIANEQRFGSQERENSAKRISCLAPITYAREENQMPISRSSNNYMHRWSSAPPTDHRCQVSEELEHRIGLIETSLNRFGRILDSIQSDIMQVNKAIKEVSLETEGVSKKLTVHDNSLQLMLKGEEEIKASLDGSLRSIPEQLRQDLNQYKLQEAVSAIATLPEQIEEQFLKLQDELCGAFTKEMKAITSGLKPSNHMDSVPSILPSRRRDCHLIQYQNEQPVIVKSLKLLGLRMTCTIDISRSRHTVVPPGVYTRRTRNPKIKVESRESLKPEPVSFTDRHHNIKPKPPKPEQVPLIELDREWRVIVESDEEIDVGFACLLKEKETGIIGKCLVETAEC